MTLAIKDALGQVYTADSGPALDFEVPNSDIESAQMSRRINRLIDEGEIVLHNDDGQYSSGAKQLQIGDRFDLLVTPDRSPDGWGEHNWAYGGWHGERLVWSTLIENVTYHRVSPTESKIVLDCVDFVFGIMSKRITFDSFEKRNISGRDSAIVETVLSRECPELDLTFVEDVDTKTSITMDGTNVLEALIKLASRANAMLAGYRDRIVFKPIADISTSFTADGSSDFGLFHHQFHGDTVVNSIRLDGGRDHTVDDEQLTQDGYTTATDSNRVTFQVSTRKSQLERVELWTRTTGSNESINLRIQKDDGGAPVDVDNSNSDIDNRNLSHEFLDGDGFTSFLLNDHTLPEPNPWVIVETDGPDGQDIGIETATDTPAYRAHYPFPVSVRLEDENSIRDHRIREQRWKQKNVTTLDEARELTREGLERFDTPERDVSVPAISRRFHRLFPGDVVTFAEPRERLEGDYMVTETQDTFNGVSFNTAVSLAEVESI